MVNRNAVLLEIACIRGCSIVLRTLRLFNDLRKYQRICFDTKVIVTFMCYCPMTVLQLSYSVVCPELDMFLLRVTGRVYQVPPILSLLIHG